MKQKISMTIDTSIRVNRLEVIQAVERLSVTVDSITVSPPVSDEGPRVLSLIGAWAVPTNVLLAIVSDDDRRIDKSRVPRTWLPPKWAKMKGRQHK